LALDVMEKELQKSLFEFGSSLNRKANMHFLNQIMSQKQQLPNLAL
jgi:hypothetical protein